MSKKRNIIIEITTTHMIDIPEDYTEDDIDFYLNDSSHCLETEFIKMMDHPENTCDTCWRAEARYIREATKQDLKDYK